MKKKPKKRKVAPGEIVRIKCQRDTEVPAEWRAVAKTSLEMGSRFYGYDKDLATAIAKAVAVLRDCGPARH